MKLKLSRFAHFFSSPEYEGIEALWHSLGMDLIFIDANTASCLLKLRYEAQGNDEIYKLLPGSESDKTHALDYLMQSGFLVEQNHNESSQPIVMADKIESVKFIGVLYLMLYDGCNLNCKYCFENVREPKHFLPKQMSQAVAKHGLDIFARLSNKYQPPQGHMPKVQLYGGEPMLNWDVFAYSVEYFNNQKRNNEIDQRIGLATVTNGTNMTRQRAEFLATNGVSVGVSLDGPRFLHNIYRKTKDKEKDAYEIAISAIKTLKEANAIMGVSVTLTPEVVDNFEDVVSFLRHEVGVTKGLGFNILHHTDNVSVDADYYQRAAMCIIDAYKQFRQDGVWEDRAMRKIMSFIDKLPLHGDCAAIGHQIVVSPEGQIGICQDYIKDRTDFAGSVFNETYDPFNDDTFVRWSKRTPFRMEACYDCPAIAVCGGGCPASIESTTGSIWNIDRRICPHSIETLKFMIWDTYENLQDTQHSPRPVG